MPTFMEPSEKQDGLLQTLMEEESESSFIPRKLIRKDKQFKEKTREEFGIPKFRKTPKWRKK